MNRPVSTASPPPPSRGQRIGILAMVAVSVPLGQVLESALRPFLGPDFEDVRAYLGPALTPVAWGLCALTAGTVLAGFGVRRWLIRRGTSRLGARAQDPLARARVAMESLLIATSIPQAPAMLSTLLALAGAHATPVTAAVVLSTVGVLAQGIDAERTQTQLP